MQVDRSLYPPTRRYGWKGKAPAPPGMAISFDSYPSLFFTGVDHAVFLDGVGIEFEPEPRTLGEQEVAIVRDQLRVDEAPEVHDMVIGHPLYIGAVGGRSD